MATLLCIVLLLWSLPLRRDAFWSFSTGVIVGLLIATHQQRGLSMGLGICAVLVAEAFLDRRYGHPHESTLVLKRLTALACGTAAVVGPMLAVVVLRAGREPVWYALVVHPLTHYQGVLYSPWGHANPLAGFTVVVDYLPAILLLSVSRLLLLSWRRQDFPRARLLMVLSLVCASAIGSIWYYPDFIHLAFIAPLLFVASAESLEWFLRALPHNMGRSLAVITATLVLGASALQLARSWTALHSGNRVTRLTGFGRVEFNLFQAALYDRLDQLLRDVPSRTLYAHPISSNWYLLLGAHNPTRFEFMAPGSYNSPAQVQEVLDALTASDVPYIIAPPALMRPDDPIVQFIRRHYEPLSDAGVEASQQSLPSMLAAQSGIIWRRKSAGPPPLP